MDRFLHKIGQWLIASFIVFLPWSVIVTVTGTERFNLEWMRFIKEIFLALIAIAFFLHALIRRHRPSFDAIDILIFLYTATLIIVSIVEHVSPTGFIYGLRYDVEFLLAFVLFRQVIPFWQISLRKISRLFLLSGGIMLIASIIIRYVFGEVFLTIFGFSGRVSVWENSGPPPIYHGIPGASVVRFQGMLEGPNQMAFFLLVYMGTYITCYFQYRKYRFFNTMIVLALLALLIITYSRSALLGFLAGSCIAAVSLLASKISQKKISFGRIPWRKILASVALVLAVLGTILFQFGGKFGEIITRRGSTSAHFERMYLGYQRFLQAPWGHGLAQAGPASRSVVQVNHDAIPIESLNPEMSALSAKFLVKNPDFFFNSEHYYIPESWYIQQLVEGGFLGLFFFLAICIVILWRTRYPFIRGMMVGVLTMNLVLHSFESVHTTLVLFLLLAFFLSEHKTLGK